LYITYNDIMLYNIDEELCSLASAFSEVHSISGICMWWKSALPGHVVGSRKALVTVTLDYYRIFELE